MTDRIGTPEGGLATALAALGQRISGWRAARAERLAPRRRRRAAALAAYGIDIGPRRIHGVRVARAGVTAWR
ncbi:hypothetical protein RKE29_09185 [Streptomyces sp. B1866]|uniref:hypothetical protein n=1 Tax=Streptomyces sp. B1866 TaxID=3075431 RepID=UPI002891619C|nr:hypothetical protein [Streptomyces sp. B1866]MDT3396813.1 hypothetical protein [Streptomyces sp. B1866]